MKKTLPGLKNFCRISHWVEPGGNVELFCASGRDVIKDLRKIENRPFKGWRKNLSDRSFYKELTS